MWRRRVVACVAAAALAAGAGFATAADNARDQTSFVKAIVFKDGVIDKKHSLPWRGGTNAFRDAAAFGTYPRWGIEIHGLACRLFPATKPVPCYLLMAMPEISSRAYFCEILPEGNIAGAWLSSIDCPTEVDWRRSNS